MIFSSIPLFLLPSLAAAYTFEFTSVPTQCQELSLAIDGQGSPPYEVLIIPVGPSTAPNNVEVRRVIDQTFPNNGTTISFPLRFPENSQFVAVVRLFALIPPSALTPVPSHRSPTNPVSALGERVSLSQSSLAPIPHATIPRKVCNLNLYSVCTRTSPSHNAPPLGFGGITPPFKGT